MSSDWETAFLYGSPTDDESREICVVLPSMALLDGALFGLRTEQAQPIWQLIGSDELQLEGSDDGKRWQITGVCNILNFRFWRITRRSR